MRFIIPIIALSLLAGPAFAADYWLNPRESTATVHNVPSPRPGKNASEYTPTTTTGNTRSPTLELSKCESIIITVYGTDLTGTIQMCDDPYEFGRALSTSECQNMTLSALDAATNTAIQMDDLPVFLRFGVITNADSAQHFQVVCNGSKK